MHTAGQFVQQYNLQAHPEGGWYKETYRSSENIPGLSLPERFGGERNFSTAIYFLLEQGNFSAFHKIKSDECWHFYAGDTLHVYVLHDDGKMEIIKLGSDIMNGELFQYVVPANCWFASRPAPASKFCFVGCTVAPGFDFADFEMAKAETLIELFPLHEKIIKELCRQ
jgi:predicted cupin superfamily sugar epimerase